MKKYLLWLIPVAACSILLERNTPNPNTYEIKVNNPSNIAFADMDQDGFLDMVCVSEDTRLLGFKGLGDGTFILKTTLNIDIAIITGQLFDGISVSDINADTFPDIVIQKEGSYSIFLGDQDSLFRKGSSIVNNKSNPGAVIFADYNNDGLNDFSVRGIVFIDIYISNGDGTFQDKIRVKSVPISNALASSDLNNDSFPDFVVATFPTGTNLDREIQVLHWNGTSATVAHRIALEDITPNRIDLIDFDKDGILDIMDFTGTLLFRKGNQDGTYQSPIPAFGDFIINEKYNLIDVNSDGIDDVVDPFTGVFIRNSDGSFGVPLEYPIGFLVLSIGDLNQDGLADYATPVAEFNEIIVILSN